MARRCCRAICSGDDVLVPHRTCALRAAYAAIAGFPSGEHVQSCEICISFSTSLVTGRALLLLPLSFLVTTLYMVWRAKTLLFSGMLINVSRRILHLFKVVLMLLMEDMDIQTLRTAPQACPADGYRGNPSVIGGSSSKHPILQSTGANQ